MTTSGRSAQEIAQHIQRMDDEYLVQPKYYHERRAVAKAASTVAKNVAAAFGAGKVKQAKIGGKAFRTVHGAVSRALGVPHGYKKGGVVRRRRK